MSTEGKEVGTVEIDPADFGGSVNRQLLHDVVLMQLANKRAGTHSTLRRGEVAGSTKKIFRQKGTGRARAGTKRTNKRRGGGTAKGPKPRDYEYHMPKKAVRAATRMAVLSKLQDQETIILDKLDFTAVKTSQMSKILGALNEHIWLSTRNIQGIAVMPVNEFNALTIMRQKRLILTRDALEALRTGSKVIESA